jgi:predicted kinase
MEVGRLQEMLIVFGGLPGTGKTTISRELAKRFSATLLRIDIIEQALLASLLVDDIGVAGYSVANALAEANLSNGQTVVVDCVNPVEISRAAWKTVAARTKSPLIQIEVVCTDRTEHRRRVEARKPDIPATCCQRGKRWSIIPTKRGRLISFLIVLN